MNWTTEYPTQPGAYWIRNYRFKRAAERGEKPTPGPRLVEVNAPYSDFYYFGIETPEHREMLLSAEWLGPIQPPQDKRRQYEYKEEILSGPQLAAEMDNNPVPVMPHRWHVEPHHNCYLDQDEIAIHRNGCVGQCELGHIRASIVEL